MRRGGKVEEGHYGWLCGFGDHCLSPYDGLGRMTEGILTRLADKGGREVWWILLLFIAVNSKE